MLKVYRNSGGFGFASFTPRVAQAASLHVIFIKKTQAVCLRHLVYNLVARGFIPAIGRPRGLALHEKPSP